MAYIPSRDYQGRRPVHCCAPSRLCSYGTGEPFAARVSTFLYFSFFCVSTPEYVACVFRVSVLPALGCLSSFVLFLCFFCRAIRGIRFSFSSGGRPHGARILLLGAFTVCGGAHAVEIVPVARTRAHNIRVLGVRLVSFPSQQTSWACAGLPLTSQYGWNQRSF